MRTSKFKFMRLGLVVLLALLALAPLGKVQQAEAQAPGPQVGLACTTGASLNPTFTLKTETGYIILPDGNTMFMWGYALDGQPFQHPGPVLCVNQGDTVTIVLRNTSDKISEPVSIIFPGQENVLANGLPAEPQFDGGNLTSLTNAAAPGSSVTYSFVASRPGTFIYESGTDPKKQVQMGLFGALIVRPAMGANYAYNRADSQFTPEEEFLVLLSEIDPYQHQAEETGQPYDITAYHTHYWLLNGRAFPDSIADNYAPWLPSQPYGALARIHPYDSVQWLDVDQTIPNPSYHPNPALVRYINVGTEDIPFHPHGNNGLVIGRDGYPLEGSGAEDLSFEKFAINIGPGQTWDVLSKWYDAENYSESNPVPVTVPDVANMQLGMFYSGSPYLGQMGQLPPGANTLNQCGEFYIISHNHALFQLDAWGMTMAGQITYLRIDPPLAQQQSTGLLCP